MKYVKHMSIQEWNRFKNVPQDQKGKYQNASLLGNDIQIKNFETQQFESQEFLTGQEILLYKYDIKLHDYTKGKGDNIKYFNNPPKKFVKVRYPGERLYHFVRLPPACPVPFKEFLKTIPSKITQENFDKGLKKFDKGMEKFNKAVQAFSSGLGDGKETRSQDKKNLNIIVGDLGKSKNTEKIWGIKKPIKNTNIPIWSEKKKKRGSKKKLKNKNFDKREKDLEKIWGKKK